MRIVLDTNVLVSGLMYPRSAPGRIVRAWRESRFDLVLSLEQLTEIGRVLAYPKIRKVLRWDDETIGRFLQQLFVRGEVVETDERAAEAPRDPTDAPILSSFITGKADYLVTGDADLLALRNRYKILEPSEFVKKLR